MIHIKVFPCKILDIINPNFFFKSEVLLFVDLQKV